jgi:hypothetical protein
MKVISKDLQMIVSLEGVEDEFITAVFDVVETIETRTPVKEAPCFEVQEPIKKAHNLRFMNDEWEDVTYWVVNMRLHSALCAYVAENWYEVYETVEILSNKG